jgi:transposase
MMPLRPVNREQSWLLPPSLDELLSQDHPARFLVEFVDGLDRAMWMEMGIDLDGEPLGAPAYHPRVLLSIWLYGFMTGVRSSRKLEAACRDQISYLWLTGWQRPDHNTLWRFYQAHRRAMRGLMKYTVRTAVELGWTDLAIQAVDGTKVAANAAGDQTYDAAGLGRLLERVEVAIAELEAQNEEGDGAGPPRLPGELTRAQGLRKRVRAAMDRLLENAGLRRVNLTDGDARLMKGRNGIITAYNAQAMVSPVVLKQDQGNGMLITAADVVNTAADSGQLIPMVEQAEEMTGERTEITLADGGYHTAANLEVGEGRGQRFVMPERYHEEVRGPYFKDRFVYDTMTDSYLCPHGQRLPFRGVHRSKLRSRGPFRVYRASRIACRSCQAYGICTKDRHTGRALWIGPRDPLLRQHREWMTSEEARRLYAWRKELSEPVFGILKEQMGARRFLLRGLANVRAEFSLLAAAFNLRTLWRVWLSVKKATSTKRQQLPTHPLRARLSNSLLAASRTFA